MSPLKRGKMRSAMVKNFMILLGFWILFSAGSMLWANPIEEDLEAKITEFEKRLEALEKRNKELKADAADSSSAEAQFEELQRQLDILAAEVEKMRSVEQVTELTQADAAKQGLGLSAASVYSKEEGLSFAGYGEMVYQNYAGKKEDGTVLDKTSQMDFLRAILYAGYRFNDKFLFNSEIEFEHGSTSKGGSASVEFAYLDYIAHENLTLRGGMLLVPMGLTNEFHEPNVFMGVHRPFTEKYIIPTTWRENGFGVVGSSGIVNYRAYMVNGLNGASFSASGLRGGRQKGAKAKASDMAFVGRLDIAPTPGVFFGGSLYHGGSGQNQLEVSSKKLKVMTTIGELHGQVQMEGWDIRGLWSKATLDDVAALNTHLSKTGKSKIANSMVGGYFQTGYNVLSHLPTNVSVMPYYRFERLNTHDGLIGTADVDLALDKTFHTFGLELKPIYNVVVKADYQMSKNKAKTGYDQLNISLGYSF
jgi:hypothetical protein